MTMTMLWMLGACAAPSGPGALVLSPGEEGPFGAAWVQLRAQARVTESIWVEVMFPSDDSGQPAPDALPAQAVVLVQGGLVEASRYRWLAAHAAARGYVVISADHPADLAFFAAGNGLAALEAVEDGGGILDGLVEPGGPAAVAGHSLGGVVASILWAADTRFDGLISMASYPADGTDVES
ncbi:MAG: putative dienelactone hydrolase, partial [Myxococcota bacterium]